VLNADAKITVVSPREGLNPEVAYRIEQKQVDYVDRKFEPSDLDGVDMVLTAVDDPEASSQIWKLCKERRIAANIADVPPECDFYFGSVHRDGPLQIMVSTNGKGPKLANIVRRQIAAGLPPNIGMAITRVGMLRKKLRQVAPDISEGPKRMQWYVTLFQHLISHTNPAQDDQGLRGLFPRRPLLHDRGRHGAASWLLQAQHDTQS
jgi:precorrin-2 dehydrogenase/sirohydrochlorin ferrochelatase